jgi:tetratricopeptide (TPR) repeat protein
LCASEHGLRYLRRARDAHDRYKDHDAQLDTALVTASVLLELGRIEEAGAQLDKAREAPAEGAAVYDKVHICIVTALCALAGEHFEEAVDSAQQATKLAEEQALVSYRVYARAIEASGRAQLGDHATARTLAFSALTSVEELEGSEYGIEVRALCCATLSRVTATDTGPAAAMSHEAYARARDYVESLAQHIRKPELLTSFHERPPVRKILEATRQVDGQIDDSPYSSGTRS